MLTTIIIHKSAIYKSLDYSTYNTYPFVLKLIDQYAKEYLNDHNIELIITSDIIHEIEKGKLDSKTCLLLTRKKADIAYANSKNITVIEYAPDYSEASLNNDKNTIDIIYAPYTISSYEDIYPCDLIEIYNHQNQIPVLIGERNNIRVRELGLEDMQALYDFEDNHYISNSIYPPCKSLDELKLLHKQYMKNQYAFYEYGMYGIFYIDENNNEILLGEAGIVDITEKELSICLEAEIAYGIKPEYRRKGYTKLAINIIKEYMNERYKNLSYFAKIAPDNAASIATAKSCNLEIRYYSN